MRKHEQRPKSAYARKEHANPAAKWLVAIVCVHLVLAGVYWHYTPYGTPPDEGPHGLYVEALAGRHVLPVFDAGDREHYESHQPPLYYLMGVPFYLIARAAGEAEPASAVRLLSMLLGALSILVVYRAVGTAFPEERRLALASAGFVALLPTHVMLSSSVSNDILAEVVFGLALVVTAQIVINGPSRVRTIALGAILGAGLLTKTTCILLFPVAVLAYLLAWQRAKPTWKLAAGHLSGLLGIGALIGGWWLVRNQLLYGDALAMRQFEQAFEHTVKPAYWLSHGWSMGTYLILVSTWTFCSFWGVFGHMYVFMPAEIYCTLGVITLAAMVGCVREELALRAKSAQNRDIILVYNLVFALVVLAFLKFNVTFYQAQGRYLYPALVPISVFWVLGIRRLLPARIRDFGAYVAVAVPLVAQIVALATCIVPKMPYYF